MTHEFLREVLKQADRRVENLENLIRIDVVTVREQATCDLLRLEASTGMSSTEFRNQIRKWQEELDKHPPGTIQRFYVMEPMSQLWKEGL
jgi:hypothetical protein